jgi:hypothetical protein
MSEDEPGWSRAEWALWWLDHDEVDEAARVLEPGDSVVVTGTDFRDLSAAVARRGLVAVFEDGRAFVYTREQARQASSDVSSDLGADSLASTERRPPARVAPAPMPVPAVNRAGWRR